MTISYKVAVMGSDENIGFHILKAISELTKKPCMVFALSLPKSNPIEVLYGVDKKLRTIPVDKFNFNQVDIVVSVSNNNIYYEYVKKASGNGCIVIDISNNSKNNDNIPIIIPEINPECIMEYKNTNIISIPSAITTAILMSVYELNRINAIKTMLISTYQSVAHAGKSGLEELYEQTKAKFFNASPKFEIFEKQIAFNCIPKIGDFDKNLYTTEENQISSEIKKVLSSENKNFGISTTCAYVPVFVGHSISLTIELTNAMTLKSIINTINETPGVISITNDRFEEYCTSIDCVGEDNILISRIRKDSALKNGISMWISMDPNQKGSSINIAQIMALLLEYDVAIKHMTCRQESTMQNA